MAYVTSIERMAEKRGRLEGVETGRLEGVEAGRQEGERAGKLANASQILRDLIERKFGTLPDWAEAHIAQGDEALLHQWTLRILDAQTIEAIFSA